MSILIFPKGFCEELTADVARFWWSRNGRNKDIHWKTWEMMTQSKKYGGMGFKDFYAMNLAHLAKQVWRIYLNPNALWVKFLKSIYFPNDSIFTIKKKGGPSWIWNSILKGRDVLIEGGRWMVGDGSTIRIWHDNWLGTKISQVPQGCNHDLKVSELINPSNL